MSRTPSSYNPAMTTTYGNATSPGVLDSSLTAGQLLGISAGISPTMTTTYANPTPPEDEVVVRGCSLTITPLKRGFAVTNPESHYQGLSLQAILERVAFFEDFEQALNYITVKFAGYKDDNSKRGGPDSER